MEVKVNLNGRKRRALAQAIGHILETEPVYKGAPTYQYDVGDLTVARDGTLLFPDEFSPEIEQRVLAHLREQGFDPVALNNEATGEPLTDDTALGEVVSQAGENTLIQTEEPETPTATGESISLPIKGFDETALENLQLLIASKSTLIKKAIGIEALPVELTDESISFPWFKPDLSEPETTAYSQFIAALCAMAKKQKRVMAVEKVPENEKYAFRCFLLRLGFIGEEYATSRKILLQNLSGNGSWKAGNGNPRRKPKPVPKALNGHEERTQIDPATNGLPKTKAPLHLASLLRKIFLRRY